MFFSSFYSLLSCAFRERARQRECDQATMLAILLQECALFSTSFALIVSQNCLNCDEQIFLLLKRTAVQALNKSDKCAHIAQQRDRRQGRCMHEGMSIHTCVCMYVRVCVLCSAERVFACRALSSALENFSLLCIYIC